MRIAMSEQRRIRCTCDEKARCTMGTTSDETIPEQKISDIRLRRTLSSSSRREVKKIAEYLGKGYHVDASVGHIRTCPARGYASGHEEGPYAKFAVDVDNGFDAFYVVDPDKRKRWPSSNGC